MTSVTPREGVRYGAYLFAYWLALLAVSAVLIGAGGGLVYLQVEGVWSLGETQGRVFAALGGFLAVVGVVVFGSGQFGLLYKLASDAVGTGVRERVPRTAPTAGPTPDDADGAVGVRPGRRRDREPGDEPADQGQDERSTRGDGTTASDERPVESPEEVASESDIAEELGFNRERRPGRDAERAAGTGGAPEPTDGDTAREQPPDGDGHSDGSAGGGGNEGVAGSGRDG